MRQCARRSTRPSRCWPSRAGTRRTDHVRHLRRGSAGEWRRPAAPGRHRPYGRIVAPSGPGRRAHRGHARARLGARRLAIMDLTTGDQPFQSPDGAIWMVCNGEIYNAPALRTEFRAKGYPFRSTGDIETIVPLYEGSGPDGVTRLEGMFGLAIWDDRARRLVLARDRAGEKPLFWTERAGEIRFASEIQALLAYPDQPRRVHRPAADLYAAAGYVPAPPPMFAGLEKLRPGELLIATAQGVTRRRYWDPAVA